MNIPDDTMNILLAKYFANEANPEEEQQVYAWIAAGEDNLRYFEAYMQVWDKSRTMPQLDIDENKAWHRFRAYTVNQPVADIRQIHRPAQWFTIAAACIVILAAAWLTFTLLTKEKEISVTLPVAAIVQTDTLPDRSVVTLNKNAELSYTDMPKQRQRAVTLKGEAFFEVTPDKEKPFVITAGQSTIRVVGTSFNIKTDDRYTEVIVRTGIVQVTTEEESITLKAGEKITVVPDAGLQKEQQQDALYNYYVSKIFICDNTPLWKLVEKLNEAYGVNIVIADKDLSNLPLTVTFSEESLDTILDILRQTLMINIAKEGDSTIIK